VFYSTNNAKCTILSQGHGRDRQTDQRGLGPQPKSNLVHFSLNMTSGGNNFNDFPKIAPTRELTTKIEKTFLFLVRDRGLFLEWA